MNEWMNGWPLQLEPGRLPFRQDSHEILRIVVISIPVQFSRTFIDQVGSVVKDLSVGLCYKSYKLQVLTMHSHHLHDCTTQSFHHFIQADNDHRWIEIHSRLSINPVINNQTSRPRQLTRNTHTHITINIRLIQLYSNVYWIWRQHLVNVHKVRWYSMHRLACLCEYVG